MDMNNESPNSSTDPVRSARTSSEKITESSVITTKQLIFKNKKKIKSSCSLNDAIPVSKKQIVVRSKSENFVSTVKSTPILQKTVNNQIILSSSKQTDIAQFSGAFTTNIEIKEIVSNVSNSIENLSIDETNLINGNISQKYDLNDFNAENGEPVTETTDASASNSQDSATTPEFGISRRISAGQSSLCGRRTTTLITVDDSVSMAPRILNSKGEYLTQASPFTDSEKSKKRREASGRLWSKVSAYVMDRPVNVVSGTKVRVEASLYHGNVVFHSVLDAQKYKFSPECRNREKLDILYEKQKQRIYQQMPPDVDDQELL